MKLHLAQCCALALLCGLGGPALAADADPSDTDRYGYCESGLAENGYVYITPVFADPPLHPEASFERYLAKTYDYDGGAVRCFSLDSEREAAGFRDQRIELFHWRHEDHILATDWTPADHGPRSPVSADAAS